MQYYTKVNVTVLTFLIPTSLLVLINCIIIGQMVNFLRRRKNLLIAHGSRRLSTVSDPNEGRTEMRRVIAYLLISFISFAFTAPYAVVLCIRAGHGSHTPWCESRIMAELSRLFNSIKDIQYAIHGYTYVFFFNFFRNRLKKIGRRVRNKCCCCISRLQPSKSFNIEHNQTSGTSPS